MEFAIGKVVILYLLLPLIAIILAVVMSIVAKKNQLLANKKIIIYILLICVILSLPGLLGFIDYWFMPYTYLILQLVYLICGWYFIKIIAFLIKGIKEKPYYVEFLAVFVMLFISAALFSLIFNLCNELKYGLWACTCMLPFIFPSIFGKAYKSFMDIPLEIYKIWSYNREDDPMDSELSELNNIIVVELELFKSVSDNEPLNIKAKASEQMRFGVWFKIFIDDYNKKSPLSPVIYSDMEDSYGWIFYTNSSILGGRKYIDPDLSFFKNGIKEKNVIIAKRTVYEEFQQMSGDYE